MVQVWLSLVLVIGLTVGCSPGSESARSGPAGEHPAATDTTPASDWFIDRAAESGLKFVHYNGASGQFYYPEILGPGVALFDYDNDGDLDVYVPQGHDLASSDAAAADANRRQPSTPPAEALPLRGRLFRNDLQIGSDESRKLRFTDVTEQSGIDTRGYGLGVAAGDIDNDGWVDLYLMNFGPNQMFRNDGDGTFTDVTAPSGTDNRPDFGVSAAFVDYDRDGWLDLYVGNNVNYTLENRTPCPNKAGARDYCPPQIYGGRPDRLYRNLGGGKFVDVTAKALLKGRFGPALGVSTADFNGDGWVDIFVANDGEDDLLWINQRNGTLVESGLTAGVAVTSEGKAEASMGVDAGDFDNDGDEDLIVTELTGEGSNLYVNDGRASFRDLSATSGLGAVTLPYTGWGTSWFDFDNDGWLDTIAVNGTIIAQGGHQTAFPYDQRKLLLRNLKNGRFENVTSQAGAAFQVSDAGRGAAFGDIDNDGDIDILVGNAAGPVRLLVNNIGSRKHWIGINAASDRASLGARVGVVRSSGALWRRIRSDGSYGSANDSRVLVGLDDSSERPRVQIKWPDGKTEEWSEVAIDRWTTLKRGTGK